MERGQFIKGPESASVRLFLPTYKSLAISIIAELLKIKGNLSPVLAPGFWKF